MHRVRRYTSPLVADQAAAFLRERGVPATVVGHHVNAMMPLSALRFTQLDLVVGTRAQRDRAVEILPEFDESMNRGDDGTLDEDWESQARPDLSALDPDLTIRCPACQFELMIDDRIGRCTECGFPFDPLDLVVKQHGPEALQVCYESEGEIEPPDLEVYEVPCRSCRYSLGGLPTRGRCPECGDLYDKEEIISRMM